MRILIHACPARMWYVTNFLVPELERQGAEEIEIWNDTEGVGNLRACMASFAAREGDGGTWHIQDDVLPAADFVERARAHDDGVVYGFCFAGFQDDPQQTGRVSVEDAWHSFQCVRIPDAYARECAAWLHGDGRLKSEYPLWIRTGKMDDSVFRTYLLDRHARETVENLRPCLVEHVDWIIGGSVLSPWRGYLARAHYWDDEARVNELKERIKAWRARRS